MFGHKVGVSVSTDENRQIEHSKLQKKEQNRPLSESPQVSVAQIEHAYARRSSVVQHQRINSLGSQVALSSVSASTVHGSSVTAILASVEIHSDRVSTHHEVEKLQVATATSASSSSSSSSVSLQHSLASSLLNASSGHESVGSNTVPSVLAGLHGSPYVNGYMRINRHPLHQSVKQLLVKDTKKITFDHLVESVNKYMASIGNVSKSTHLLMDESEPTIGIAKRIVKRLQEKNQQYKSNYDDELFEELKCISIVGARIHGQQFHFISMSGALHPPSARRLTAYLKDIVRQDSSIILLPAISNKFKRLVDFFGQLDLEIPAYNLTKNCAEFSFLATLAKLFYTYGHNVFVTGVVNVPVMIADDNTYESDINKTSAAGRLGAWQHGKPWEFEGHLIHHWQCCNNCKNNKPLYLSILGVMQDLGSKKLTVNTDLDVSEDEELLTSPLHARLTHLMEVASARAEDEVEAQMNEDFPPLSQSTSTSSSAAAVKPRKQEKHFDFAVACRQEASTNRVNYSSSPHILNAPRRSAVTATGDVTHHHAASFIQKFKK